MLMNLQIFFVIATQSSEEEYELQMKIRNFCFKIRSKDSNCGKYFDKHVRMIFKMIFSVYEIEI